MNENYLEFNNWAFEYYKYRNSYSIIGTLAIEVIEIENYCKKHSCDLKFLEIIEQDWSKLLQKDHNGNPKFFGLVALQCYAASLMENDSTTSVKDYKTRFNEISGNISEMQNIFKEEIEGISVQEKIWIKSKEFLSTIGININIPKIKSFKGKYIQYPLSQVILNQEDLKEYVGFFIEIEKLFDEISFNTFQKYYKNNIGKFQFNRRNNLKEDRPEYQINIKLKQIFDFYCSENWKVIAESLATNKIKIEEPKYILYYNELAEIKFKLYDEGYSEIEFTKVIFQKSKIKGIIFFKKSDEYENEFDLVNYLEDQTEYVLVANNDSSLNDLKIIKGYFENLSFNNENLDFFKGKIDVNNLPNEFVDLINEPYPLKLMGMKISRKKQYLISFPPKIINEKNKDYRIYPEYNIDDLKVGNYQIRIPGFSNLNFEIIENPKLKEIVHAKELGFKISNLNIVENGYDVQGLHYSKNQQLKDESLSINKWIDIQNGNLNSKQEIQTYNIILKALKWKIILKN